jgi:hypothetical protein
MPPFYQRRFTGCRNSHRRRSASKANRFVRGSFCMCAVRDKTTKPLGARGFSGFCQRVFAWSVTQLLAAQGVGFCARIAKHAFERHLAPIKCARTRARLWNLRAKRKTPATKWGSILFHIVAFQEKRKRISPPRARRGQDTGDRVGTARPNIASAQGGACSGGLRLAES